MKILRIAQQENVAQVMSLDGFIRDLPQIKQAGVNVVSIRDSERISDEKTKQKYATIDAAGLDNMFAVTFDDLAEPSEMNIEEAIFPQADQIQGVLNWAKQKWEENGKTFVVHCTGGVSRSSAIAMLINQMILNNYRAGWDIKLHSPNTKVLDYGAEHLGVDSFSDTVRQETIEYDRKTWEEEDYYSPF